jgi:hypothetical protein
MQVTKLGPPHDVLATLVNFASHPESLGSDNTVVTSDFPHYAREAIEASQGGMAIWVSGDLGVLQGPLDIDVLDPLAGQPAVRRTFRWAQVHGEQLAELERRELVEAPPVWLRLLSAETPARDRITAARAAGASASAPVRSRLVELLSDPDAHVAAAAAAALGAPGNRDAVAPLANALSHGAEPVRMAAIRGLGRIGTPEARKALQTAAASHPDPDTQRRARAELRRLRAASLRD